MEELRRLRKQRGLTQAQLAVQAGLDPSSLSQIETGARQPNTRTLEKLAGVLGVEVRDLFPLEQPPLPNASAGHRQDFLEYIRTLDRAALEALSAELDEQQMRELSGPEFEDVVKKGLMVRLQIRLVDNPDAKFEPVETERKLAALAGAA